MINLRAFIWLISASIAAAASDYVQPLQDLGAALAFACFIGAFYSLIPRRIAARGAVATAACFGAISFFIAGKINAWFTLVMAERAVAVYVAPIAEEILKAGGVYVVALKRKGVLRSWRVAALCGALAGLVFGVVEGIVQPSIWRPVTALTHALGTMLFALGVRFMVVGKGRRDGVLAGLCMAAAILEHMTWNALAPLVLP